MTILFINSNIYIYIVFFNRLKNIKRNRENRKRKNKIKQKIAWILERDSSVLSHFIPPSSFSFHRFPSSSSPKPNNSFPSPQFFLSQRYANSLVFPFASLSYFLASYAVFLFYFIPTTKRKKKPLNFELSCTDDSYLCKFFELLIHPILSLMIFLPTFVYRSRKWGFFFNSFEREIEIVVFCNRFL